MFRFRPVFAIVVAVFAVFSAAAMARAADTSYLSLAGPNPLYAPCPTTLTFNGSITGPGNSSVTYVWARFVNGKSSDSAPVTATIPSSGTLNIPPQQLTVDKGTAGFQSYNLFITSPAGSDSTTHGKVFFTVNCVIVRPSPIPCLICPRLAPAAPVNLTNTQDPQVCTNHGGLGAGLLCPDIIAKGYLILVWDWSGDQTYPNVDGFNVYEVENGLHKRIDQQPSPDFTMRGIQPSGNGFAGRCYAVTAYKGNAESFDSNHYCVSGHVGTSFTNLGISQWGWRYKHHEANLGALGGAPCTSPCIGFAHYARQNSFPVPDDQEVYVDRGYYLFDQSQINGLSVYRATLTVRPISGDINCIAQMGPANANFVGNTNWVDADFNPPWVVGSSGGTTTFEVTSIVRAWANGSVPNYGFAMRGSNEDTGAFDNNHCMVILDNSAVLSIEHL